MKIAVNIQAIVIIALFLILTGCVEINQVDTDQIREYSDPISENILSGMNENNYSKYSEHFDQTMKNAMTMSVFNETNILLKSKIGDYVSKEFWKIECENQYSIVYYNTKFTREPGNTIVKVVFQEYGGEIKVSGLWFDSPKLREK